MENIFENGTKFLHSPTVNRTFSPVSFLFFNLLHFSSFPRAHCEGQAKPARMKLFKTQVMCITNGIQP